MSRLQSYASRGTMASSHHHQTRRSGRKGRRAGEGVDVPRGGRGLHRDEASGVEEPEVCGRLDVDAHAVCVCHNPMAFSVLLASATAEMDLNRLMADAALDAKDRVLIRKQSVCGVGSNGAALEAFINWAEKHPEKWAWKMQLGVNLALHETWLCKSADP